MNLLLDTHLLLWAAGQPDRLSAPATRMLSNGRNIVHFSVVSLWEIAIKFALGRGDMPISSQQALAYFQQSGYRILAVEAEHTSALEQLPPLHQDPFDRLLVAQAMTEPMQLLTHDAQLSGYGPHVVRC